MLLAIVAAVGFALASWLGVSVSLPVAGSAITMLLGAPALVAVAYRTLDPPGGGLERELPLYLGLLACAGIVFGGWMGMQEGPARSQAPNTHDPAPSH